MKNITLRQFRIFESVARNLSFSRAAEDLHLTQPAVSMQIEQMEGLAGLPLFLQTAKRIALTDGGRLILRHGQVILADLVTGGVQTLRVGLITSAGGCFPHLLRAFLAERTNIDLDLTVRSRDHLLQLLRCDQLDLAVMQHWHVVHRGERSLPRAARDLRQFLLDEAATRLDQLH